jgi:hypothetical protein
MAGNYYAKYFLVEVIDVAWVEEIFGVSGLDMRVCWEFWGWVEGRHPSGLPRGLEHG